MDLLAITLHPRAPHRPRTVPAGVPARPRRPARRRAAASLAVGLAVALAVQPESSEFRGWYPEPGRAELASLLVGLACEFDCPLIDAREWLPDALIGDGHHLTGSGVDAFTERLVREELAPWLSAPANGGSP